MARDGGLQPERTALAWSRTAHGALVNALVLLRAGVVDARRELVATGLLLLVAAGLTYGFARARRRALAHGGACAALPASAALGIAAMTGLCSAAAALAIVLAPVRG